ncbi:hypothetical protein GCM10008018_21360 [Paenibacillus marchantiophytorum]|uniref:YknX-like barrel-sandwich hybrid domain-containing protein n=1 Tax=Paenibacillus marchantiophytorum TaxID=1619310 RepID=A0ABQ1EK93_9BACL|nr:efflux RND transporter periplasmic adaptor subunit [Paenibacillus marchantiophytorum]GFZ75846.1 hypothetical protein GCM10008018_21360 [Paenibacillus marchantiophytorum]
MKKKRIVIISIVAIVLISAGASAFLFLNGGEKQPSTDRVTAKVTKGSIVVNVAGSGAVAPASKVTAKSADAGKIKTFLVKEGDIVKKGQELATYESKDMTEEIKLEEINLQLRLQDLEDLQRKMKEQLREGDAEELKSSISKMNLNIETARWKISSLKKEQKAPSPLIAQTNGEIVKLYAVEGDQVAAGTNIAEIVDYQNMQVVITVDELEIPKMKTGLFAAITVDALPGQTFTGKVTKIAKEGKAQNGVSTFEVTVGFDQAQSVLAGMTAQANIVAEEKKDVLIVPIEAVQEFGAGAKMVLVPSAGPASVEGRQGAGADPARGIGGEPKPVEVGIHTESLIEIKSGLQEGDQIILPTVTPRGG